MRKLTASFALVGGLLFVLAGPPVTAGALGTGAAAGIAASADASAAAANSATAPADAVYLNGHLYTVDEHDSVQEALAVRAGRIGYVGSDAGARALIGANTRVIDL